MKNLINKLTFEIGCPTEDQALGIRQNLTQVLQDELAAGIDRICSKYTQETEAIRIDKLKLDLGQFNPYTFDRHIVDTFLSRFEEALLTELADIPLLDRENSRSYSQLDTLIYFLETGQKAWWESGKLTDLNESLTTYLKKDNSALLNFLKSQGDNTVLWRRVGMQFNALAHEKLVAKIPVLRLAADLILRYVYEISGVLGLRTSSQKRQVINSKVIANRVNFGIESDIPRQALRLFRVHIPLLLEDIKDQDLIIIERIAEALAKEKNESGNNHEPTGQSEAKVPIGDASKYLSDHGGAVIVSQFLKPLYKNLGLFVDGAWKDTTSQHKAVHLINYLCTGEVLAAEYELNIEKLLCGLPLNAPIPLNVDLTTTDIGEADLVLESIIEYWGVLKNTTVAGLRNTFLLRECIITHNNTHWQINIERKTVDVLLDKLPWGFSVIIAPWNDYQIYVEW